MILPISLVILGIAEVVNPQASLPTGVEPYRVLRSFIVGGEGGWDYLAVDSDSKRLYVSRGTRVVVLDAETGASVGEIPDTPGVHGIAIAGALGKGFVSNGRGNNVTVFDLKTLKTLQTVAAGTNPDAIIFEPVTKRVFAFNGRSKDATVIGAEDLKIAGTIPLGGKPEFAAIDGWGGVFVNIEDTSELVRIDAKTLTVQNRYSLSPGEEPSGLAIDAPHHLLFAVCGNEKMIVVDSTTGKVLGAPAIGKGTDGAAFDASDENRGVALSSNGDGTMTVVATGGDKPFEVVQTLTTAPRARTIVVDPKTHRAYLPTADFEPAGGKDESQKRPVMKPGTFRILVVGK